MPPQEPNGLLLFALCFVAALGLIGLLKLNHWWHTRGSVKGFDRGEARPQAPASSVMSRPLIGYRPDRPVAPPVAPAHEKAGQLIATTDNEDNDELPEQQQLAEEVREIMRFQAKAEALAMLYRSGQVSNLAKAIETTFECSRSSKEDSTYQKAKRVIDPLIAKPAVPTPIGGRPTNAVFRSDIEEVV